jgi:hypothetical protein
MGAMVKGERKLQVLTFLSTRQWVRVPVIAAAVGYFPIRGFYWYMKKKHRWGYVHRGRDFQGRIVYRLSPRGAEWLLRRRRRAGSVVLSPA